MYIIGFLGLVSSLNTTSQRTIQRTILRGFSNHEGIPQALCFRFATCFPGQPWVRETYVLRWKQKKSIYPSSIHQSPWEQKTRENSDGFNWFQWSSISWGPRNSMYLININQSTWCFLPITLASFESAQVHVSNRFPQISSNKHTTWIGSQLFSQHFRRCSFGNLLEVFTFTSLSFFEEKLTPVNSWKLAVQMATPLAGLGLAKWARFLALPQHENASGCQCCCGCLASLQGFPKSWWIDGLFHGK